MMENATIRGKKRILAEKYYKNLFNSIPQSIWIVEIPSLHFTDVNQEAIKTYGYTHEEFLNLSVTDICLKENISLLEQILTGKLIKPFHSAGWNFVKKDGSIICTELFASDLTLANNKYLLIQTRDTTNFKEFDDSLQLSAAIVNSSEDAIISKTLDGLITSWNEGAERMYGYSKFEILNKPVSLLIPPENSDEFDTIMNKIRNGERIIHFQTTRVRKDGTRLAVSISISPVKDKFNKIIGASTIARDIADLKLMEQERDKLLRSEINLRYQTEMIHERLVFLSEASKILSSSLDYETTLTSIAGISVPFICDWCLIDLIDENNKIKRVTAVFSETVSKNLTDQSKERVRNLALEGSNVSKVIKTGKPIYYSDISTEYFNNMPLNPEIISIVKTMGVSSIMIVPLKSREKIFGAISLVINESHRNYNEDDLSFVEEVANRAALAIDNVLLYKDSQMINAELEKRVKIRTEQLEAVNNELETFSYSVSHDLKAPLRAIEGFSKLLLEEHSGQLDEEAKRLFNIVISNTGRMSQLIEDLLEFSRVTRTQMSKIKIDMTKLVVNVFNDLKSFENGRKINFVINDLPQVDGDPSMLRQVWINLISNAIKFTRPRDEAVIQVGQMVNNGEKVFFIKDNGVGFDVKYSHNLFGVFQRLHKYKDFEGTGVGLALVERIVKRHGGRIWAEAIQNEGASFYFTLSGNGE
jgi:PAS domain S-box-containing protein